MDAAEKLTSPGTADRAGFLLRLKSGAAYYVGGVYRHMNDKPVFLWAQAIAFKVFITIVPVIVLAVAVFANVLRRDRPFEAVADFVRDFLPAYQSERLIDALHQLQASSGTLTAVSLIGLAFFAMTLFTTLRVVVSSVFQEEWHETRTILGGYLFDLRMAAQVGLVFLLTFALTLAMQATNALGVELLQDWGLEWMRAGWQRTFTYLGLLVPFLLSVAMFFQLFYFIPKPHPPKRSALIGAVVTALLWELAKLAFTFYAARVGRFERYRTGDAGDAAIAGLGDTFGIILAFVFWVYYSGVVLCIGAIIALLHEKQHRMRRKQSRAGPLGQQTAGEAPEAVDENATVPRHASPENVPAA